MPDFIEVSNHDYAAGLAHFKAGGTMREAFNRSESNPEGDPAFMLGFVDGFLYVIRALAARPDPR